MSHETHTVAKRLKTECFTVALTVDTDFAEQVRFLTVSILETALADIICKPTSSDVFVFYSRTEIMLDSVSPHALHPLVTSS